MATIQNIARAGLMKKGLQRVFKTEPELDIQHDYVRVYFPPDRLPAAQKQFEIMVSRPSDVRVDLTPVMTPYLARKYSPILLLLLAAAAITGGLMAR